MNPPGLVRQSRRHAPGKVMRENFSRSGAYQLGLCSASPLRLLLLSATLAGLGSCFTADMAVRPYRQSLK